MNLRDDIKAGIIALAKQHGVEKVILFGSRARGDNRERSDIDLAARGGDMTRFTLDVDDRLPTLLKFDVVNLDEPVQPELLAAIRHDGIVLYDRKKKEAVA